MTPGQYRAQIVLPLPSLDLDQVGFYCPFCSTPVSVRLEITGSRIPIERAIAIDHVCRDCAGQIRITIHGYHDNPTGEPGVMRSSSANLFWPLERAFHRSRSPRQS